MLCLQLVLGNGFLGEAAKLPFLWAHFQQYAATTPDAARFSAYLYLHYADRQHRQSDGEHEHLPFFSGTVGGLTALRPDDIAVDWLRRNPAPLRRGAVFTHEALLPGDFRSGVLQPPERCI